MNKLLHLHSIFTKVILAILSFAVIVCVFIPYTKIPAIDTVHDIDVENKTLSILVGKEAETVNIISEFGAGQPFLMYKDEELTETVNMESLPIPNANNTYYLQLYAKGYDVNDETHTLDFVPLSVYKVVLKKGTKNDAQTRVLVDRGTKTINVDVPNTTNFDFGRVIQSRTAWVAFPNRFGGTLDARSNDNEVTNIRVDAGKSKTLYVAMAVKSETALQTGEVVKNDSGEQVYYYSALDVYTLSIEKSEDRRTLPTVGEVGMGIKSKKLSEENNGALKLYTGDMFMFIFMIAGAISCLLALIVPNKAKYAELVVAVILGAALIVVPLMDYGFFTSFGFDIEVGWFVLIALGVLIILMGAFDCWRCVSEYREEQIRIYGPDVFKKSKEKAPKEPKEPKAPKASKKDKKEQEA